MCATCVRIFLRRRLVWRNKKIVNRKLRCFVQAILYFYKWKCGCFVRTACSLLDYFHRRLEPQLDDSEIELEATLDDSTSADWTQVTFKRDLANLDVQQVH